MQAQAARQQEETQKLMQTQVIREREVMQAQAARQQEEMQKLIQIQVTIVSGRRCDL